MVTAHLKQISKTITWRYLLALGLIASVATLAFFVLYVNIHGERDRVAVINTVNAQRVLAERIAFFANAYVGATSEQDQDDYRHELQRALNQMRVNHEGLSRDPSVLGLEADVTRPLAKIYFDAGSPFDDQVLRYFNNAQAILDVPHAALSDAHPDVIALNLAGMNLIPQTHDLMSRNLQSDSERAIQRMQNVEIGIWITTLLLLVAEIFLIFRPLALRVSRSAQALRAAEREALGLAEKAEAAALAKSQFLANMSHEIRTPMNGVLGMLDLMLHSEMNADQRSRVETARESARGLLTILNDVLDFSKLEAGHLNLENVSVNVAQISNDIVSLFESQASEKNIGLSCYIEQGVPEWVQGDPTRVRQVMTNLVGNAIKFTSVGSVNIAVTYAGGADDGLLRCEVRDTGVGIPEADQGQLFERFAQADASTTRQYGGTGLGLAISKQLIELMGGEIRFQSKPGVGSAFWFTVPTRAASEAILGELAVSPNATPDGAVVQTGDAGADIETDIGELNILIAEDNATNQKVIEALLAYEGHRATIVNNGAEALAAIQRMNFDLILMDIHMPVMDGLTATRSIRASGGWGAYIPIVALTANAMAGDRERYLAEGMTDHVTKPIDTDQLTAALSRAAKKVQALRDAGLASDVPDTEAVRFGRVG